MLTVDELTLKIEALEAEASALGEADGAPILELAMQWRLLKVQAVVMEAIRSKLGEDDLPQA